jgi:serine/threonine protein kinase
MSTWNPRANELFLKAMELRSFEERRALLDRDCGADGALRAEVEQLLEASDRAGNFLDRPAVEVGITTVAPRPGDETAVAVGLESAGSEIGPYKLLQEIGEGGMGTVYMAEQTQPVRRKVALKVIKPGMNSRQVIARFEAERQALAMMDHVNIARVLDAGATEAGLPYFVMELVHGVPITRYCDDNHLTPRRRLELFVPVCRAIQHATSSRPTS